MLDGMRRTGAEGVADIPLWVGIDQKHAMAARRQTRRHVDCRGRLPHAALHVHYGDLAHRLSGSIHATEPPCASMRAFTRAEPPRMLAHGGSVTPLHRV